MTEPRFAARSTVGPKRSENQDRFVVRPEVGAVLLADGVAGRPHGARAADLAIAAADAHLVAGVAANGCDLAAARALVRGAFQVANWAVLEASRCGTGLSGMATTLVCGLLLDQHAVIASVGNSRVYRLRHGFLKQVTSDHVFRREGIELLTSEERVVLRPLLHVLSRTVGGPTAGEPDVVVESLAPEDVFLVCSNGLSDVLPADEMAQIMLRAPSFHAACDALLSAAEASGADDDMTAIVLDTNLRRHCEVAA